MSWLEFEVPAPTRKGLAGPTVHFRDIVGPLISVRDLENILNLHKHFLKIVMFKAQEHCHVRVMRDFKCRFSREFSLSRKSSLSHEFGKSDGPQNFGFLLELRRIWGSVREDYMQRGQLFTNSGVKSCLISVVIFSLPNALTRIRGTNLRWKWTGGSNGPIQWFFWTRDSGHGIFIPILTCSKILSRWWCLEPLSSSFFRSGDIQGSIFLKVSVVLREQFVLQTSEFGYQLNIKLNLRNSSC